MPSPGVPMGGQYPEIALGTPIVGLEVHIQEKILEDFGVDQRTVAALGQQSFDPLQLGGPQPGGGAVHHVGALGPTHLPSFFVALLSVRLSDTKNTLGQRDGYSIPPKRLSESTSHKQQKLSDPHISVTAGTQQALGYRCRGQCRRNLMVVHTSAGNLGMF